VRLVRVTLVVTAPAGSRAAAGGSPAAESFRHPGWQSGRRAAGGMSRNGKIRIARFLILPFRTTPPERPGGRAA